MEFADPFESVYIPDRRPRLTTVPGGRLDLDWPIKQMAPKMAALYPVQPIRIRIAPAIYDGDQYQGWAKVTWIVEFAQVSQVTEFRRALDRFIRDWVRQQEDLWSPADVMRSGDSGVIE